MIWTAIHHVAEHVLALIGTVTVAVTLLIAKGIGRSDRRRLWRLDPQTPQKHGKATVSGVRERR
jgi:hypothetical protein